MKSNLTPEQSQRLIELGVDPSKASENTEYGAWADSEHGRPIFTLSDIISLIPKEIEISHHIVGTASFYRPVFGYNDSGFWYAFYTKQDITQPRTCVSERGYRSASELIDALYELLVWCVTNKHLKV